MPRLSLQLNLLTKPQHCGWTVSRATVKIESRVRGVLDVQVLYLAEVLQVGVGELFPRANVRRRSIESVLNRKNFAQSGAKVAVAGRRPWA